jgi:hypothetical protein
VISSVLKNETIIEAPDDVDGVLELCHVLIKDQTDSAAPQSGAGAKEIRRQGPYHTEREDLAEEQGWVARMVHLFRADSLDIQFDVRIFSAGVFPGLTCCPAVTNGSKTSRSWWRADALYVPCTHHFQYQVM